jgi:hypothetical protein
LQFGLRLGDHCFLQIEPAGKGRDRRIFCSHRCLGLRHLGRKIAVVDDKQHVVLFDRLVVGNAHLLDVALDFGADHRHVTGDIGVVGRLHEPPIGPPAPAAIAAKNQRQRDRGDHELLAHPL